MLYIFFCIIRRHMISASSIIGDAQFDHFVKVVSISTFHCKVPLVLLQLVSNTNGDTLRPCESLVSLMLLAWVNYLICSCNSVISSGVESPLPTIMHFFVPIWTHGLVFYSVGFNLSPSLFVLMFKLFLIWPMGEPFNLKLLSF